MPEDSARALKAASPMTVKFGDKECQVRPLGLKELTEVERECLKIYKRNYLETFAENADLLPNGQGQDLLREKIEEVARWDLDDLEAKEAFDPKDVKVTKKLKEYVIGFFKIKKEETTTTERVQRLTSALLDQKYLTVDAYKELTDKVILPVKVPYVNWWITGDKEGMLTMAWMEV